MISNPIHVGDLAIANDSRAVTFWGKKKIRDEIGIGLKVGLLQNPEFVV